MKGEDVPVLKEPPDRKTADRLQAAGDAAERQMAFYLRRAFGESPDVFVINDLRLVEGDDAAQIDHLVIHSAGAVIIESKSVTQKVRVNARGEWARIWDGHWKGMASPIMQARYQVDFLRAYLQKRKSVLRDKVLIGLVQGGFAYFDMSVLVAVSDQGIIERDAPELAPEALKADQVAFEVERIIARQVKAAGLGTAIFGKADDFRPSIRPHEVQRVVDLLLKEHVPLEPVEARDVQTVPVNKEVSGIVRRAAMVAPLPDPVPEAVAKPTPVEPVVPESTQAGMAVGAVGVCKACGASDLTILYGKFGYYWKCGCGANTVINKTAPDGRQGKKLRKQGRDFFLVFDDGQEVLFHTNPEAAAEAVT